MAADKSGAAASWEEVPPGAHILLVDTHIMGRAEMPILTCFFVTSDGNSLSGPYKRKRRSSIDDIGGAGVLLSVVSAYGR